MSIATIEREFVLPPYGELRIATPLDPPVDFPPTTIVVRGSGAGDVIGVGPRAEIAGWPLEADVPQEVGAGRRLAVLSPSGACVLLRGHRDVVLEAYAAAGLQCMARSVVDIHHYLEARRIAALKAPPVASGEAVPQGPRVLICGTDGGSGKSTMARTLTNYAVAQGYQPVLWDLDVARPVNVGFPCALNAAAVQHPLDLDDGLMVPGQHIFFGFARSLEQNPQFFMHGVSRLWQSTRARLERHEPCGCSGLIIDFPTLDAASIDPGDTDPTSKSAGVLAALLHTIDECGVDTVIVVGDDWLRHQLRCAMLARGAAQAGLVETASEAWARLSVGATSLQTIAGVNIRAISIEASDAAVPLTAAEFEAAHTRRWLGYFHGAASTPLSPRVTEVPVDHVKFVQMGAVATAKMQQLLPMGDEMASDAASISYVNSADVDLNNRVAAVSTVSFFLFGEPDELTGELPPPTERDQVECEAELRDCVISGFVLIVGMDERHVRLLSVMPELPPGPTLLITESALQGRHVSH